ncbi:hypothetical protein [Comamonas sp.]|uniref:hypothetical protein n=1 Tax=Comamonas sp. TaxID=34028 RepID=UPI003A959E3C
MFKATAGWIAKLVAAGTVAVVGLMAAGVAQAHGGVSLSVGIGVPGVVVGAPVYMPPPPVYMAPPRPVYYAPPPPVYYEPRPVYAPAPVYVAPGYGYYRGGPRYWNGHRGHHHHYGR